MSVNQIDVNAVNKRTRQRCCENDCFNDDQEFPEPETERIVQLSKFLKGSIRWRLAYFLLKFILVLESIVWTLMDLLRAWRMRVSARINDNYNRSQNK